MTVQKTRGRSVPAEGGATSAAAWRAGELVRLPGSGHIARLRKPSLRALLHSGRVPSALVDSVYRLANPVAVAQERTDEERRTLYQEQSAAFIYVAAQCLVEPKLVLDKAPNYEAGEIGPDDVSDLDYIWLFYSWTEAGAEEATPFRVISRAGDAGLAGEALSPAA